MANRNRGSFSLDRWLIWAQIIQRTNISPLHPAMLRSIPLRYISLYGCRRISLKITEPSVENTSALPDGSVIFILAWLVAYSNSSLQSCYVVFFVGFNGRNQGVLSNFYLLRGFFRDCIVILLSLIRFMQKI